MKPKQALLLFFVVPLASGCASVNVKGNLLTLDQGFFPPEQTISLASSSQGDSYRLLRQAYKQVTPTSSDSSGILQSNAAAEPLPAYLANEPLVQKIVIAAYEALVDEGESVIEVSKGDISSMTLMLNENYGASAIRPAASQIDNIIRQYLIAYYSDTENGFVNREGAIFKRPEIKNSIGNDVITAVVAISMEGLFDGLLSTPVYIDGANRYQTSEGHEPSAHRYTYAALETIVAEGEKGIDERELKAIRYLSGLAGDKSKTLAGAAFRAFGGLEISLVIGGKFSFGDNDTLAKILDTTFEVASKRIVEAGAYKGFKNLTVDYQGKSAKTCSLAEALLREIE
jgi:hypothetical protein